MRWLAVLTAIAGLAATSAWAQGVGPGGQTLANTVRDEAARAAARQSAETAKPGLAIDITPVDPVEAEAFCLPITAINVEGVTLVADELVNETLARYARDCMGPIGVDQLLQALTDLYLESGYITSRAYIPEQDVSGGTLTLVVVEGFVEAVAISYVVNGQPVADVPASRLSRALGLRAGDPLELRTLEQGLDQVSLPGSAQTALDIQPGTQIGGSVLVLEIADDDRVRGNLSLLTSVQDGEVAPRLSFNVTADNLLQVNDIWSISFSGTESSNALTGNIALPLHRATFDLSFGFSEQLSLISPTVELLEQTPSVGLGYTFLINRNANSKTRLSLRHAREKTFRYANGVSLTPVGVWLTRIGVARDIIGNGTFTGLSAALSQGRADGGGGYSIFEASARHFRGFENGGQLYVSAAVQAASDELPSAHRIFIGGTGQVRGFETGSFGGDHGLTLSAEYSAPRLFESKSETKLMMDFANLRPYIFTDAGTVRQINGVDTVMMSVGGGVRGNIGRMTLDMGLALPVAASGFARKQGLGVRLTLGTKIF
ncbi:ShlB/FhaC/HecB family hemolysin secretion/activation protein [uncultured Tateyamaria sp.]|uniref:ShlB/FhaC/HecB family hemolysin secretion/activation protein n=1 Tax=uncultured Tateyamaria sp. TaxID=455651 RepID=UPI002608F858|nr:ShlB/FhaC/HecB family hemolysin secretion/activation protein [uncultured Tateyamaria sp.]